MILEKLSNNNNNTNTHTHTFTDPIRKSKQTRPYDKIRNMYVCVGGKED